MEKDQGFLDRKITGVMEKVYEDFKKVLVDFQNIIFLIQQENKINSEDIITLRLNILNVSCSLGILCWTIDYHCLNLMVKITSMEGPTAREARAKINEERKTWQSMAATARENMDLLKNICEYLQEKELEDYGE